MILLSKLSTFIICSVLSALPVLATQVAVLNNLLQKVENDEEKVVLLKNFNNNAAILGIIVYIIPVGIIIFLLSNLF